jgi:hypothetical protein
MTPEERRAMHQALREGATSLLESLVVDAVARYPADVLTPSTLFAAQSGRVQAVLALLGGRAPDAEDDRGNSVVSVAASSGHLSVLEAVANQPWSVAAGSKALRLAVQNDHRHVFDWLLSRGVDVNGADAEASTLRAAAGRDHTAWIEVLVAKGADVRRHGPAALKFALERHKEAGARAMVLLLNEPLDGRTLRALVQAAEDWGNRPVMAAVRRLTSRDERPTGGDVRGVLVDTIRCPGCNDITLELRDVDSSGRLRGECAACEFETWYDNGD